MLNVILNNSDLGIALPTILTAPELRPEGGSPLLAGAAFAGPVADTFFEQVTFRGAFGANDWTSGWTNWNPQNTAY